MKTFSLAKTLLVLLSLVAIEGSAQDWNQIQKVTSDVREDEANYGNSVSIEGNVSVVGTFADDTDENGENPLTNAGAVYINELIGGEWVQTQKIVASDRAANAFFGNAAVISGDYMVVGAYSEAMDENGENLLDDAGAAYIFEKNSEGLWVEIQKILASDREDFNYFGTDVNIDGNYIIVGAPNNGYDTNGGSFKLNAGAAYLYERNDDTGIWEFANKIVGSDRQSTDFFGAAVSISGTRAIVGCRGDDENENGSDFVFDAGSVYIFQRDFLGVWFQFDKIAAPDREMNDWFGISADIEGDRIAVGARQEDDDADGIELNDAGSIYIYDLNDSNDWINTQKITPSDRGEGDLFGFDVSLSGDRILVASRSDDEDENDMNFLDRSGSAYIFEFDLTETWVENQKIVAEDRGAQDFFGTSVALFQDQLSVGARGENEDVFGENTLDDSGSAYYFRLCAAESSSTSAFLCNGDSILINNNYVFTSGVYNDTLNTVLGCDSIVTINLNVTDEPEFLFSEEDLCEGESFDWNGEVIAEEGIYTLETVDENGCLIAINELTVVEIPLISTEESFTICEGEGIFINGEFENEPGEYINTYSSSLGCDSVVTTTLFVNDAIVTNFDLSACDGESINVNGTDYFSDIIIQELLEAETGCDSTVVWNLEFIELEENQMDMTICEGESIIINGIEVSESGTYEDTILSELGCDSITNTINLTVFDSPIVDLGEDLTICDTITFFLDAGAGFDIYDWSDGSSEQTLLVEETDTYSVMVEDENGCTATDEVEIIVETCVGLEEYLLSQLSFYPNPAIEHVVIESKESKIDQVRIYDISGRLIRDFYPNSNIHVVTVSGWTSGEYIIELLQESTVIRKKFIKS